MSEKVLRRFTREARQEKIKGTILLSLEFSPPFFLSCLWLPGARSSRQQNAARSESGERLLHAVNAPLLLSAAHIIREENAPEVLHYHG